MKNRILLLLLCVFSINTLHAQLMECNHSIGVNVGGGLHTLIYSPKEGSKSMGAGALLQVQYQYLFSKRWSVGVIMGLSSFHSSAIYNYESKGPLSTHPDVIEPENPENQYYSIVNFNNLQEEQNMWNVSLAFECFHTHPFSGLWALHTGFGLSFNFPVSLSYKITQGSYNVKGNFPYYDLDLENIPEYGLTKTPQGESGNTSHRVINLGIVADIGMIYMVKEDLNLYMGVYWTYQYLSTTQSSKEEMFNASTLRYNNSLNSHWVEGVHPFEMGVKVGLRFGLGR